MYKEGLDMDMVFKGLLRPPMSPLGVPLIPLIVISFPIIWLGMVLGMFVSYWWTAILAGLLIPILFTMREMIKKDENIFKLLFMKLKFIGKDKNKAFFGTKTYIANSYKSLKKELPQLSIVDLEHNPSLEELLPFSSLLTSSIVKTDDYDLLITWEVKGVTFEVEQLELINARINLLNMVFKQTSTKKIAFYVHTLRDKTNENLDFHYENDYLNEFATEYAKTFNKDTLYKNAIYLTLVYTPLKSNMNKDGFKRLNIATKKEELKYFVNEFNELASRVESTLREYSLTRLSTYRENNITYSKQLEFYNRLIGAKEQKIRALNAPLKEYITGSLQNINVGKKTLVLNYADSSKTFVKIIEFKDYTSFTYAGILNVLLYLDIRFTITQSFIPLPKIEAQENLKMQQNRLISAEDDGGTQEEELNIARNDLATGEISFGEYHYTLTVYADDKRKLDEDVNEAIAELTALGFIPTLADMALTASYFSQLPSNFAYRVRVGKISSRNFATFTSLHNFPVGKKNQNCWGDAVAIFQTPSKQPYFFNQHQTLSMNDFGKNNLGNCFIVAEAGAGKTALMNFLMLMFMKYDKPSTFPSKLDESKKKIAIVFFDFKYGAMGNILAGGGKYITIKNGVPSGFNPFMCQTNKTNIANIQRLIKMLVTRNNQTLNAQEEKDLNRAINFIMNEYEQEQRTYPISKLLDNLTEDFTQEDTLVQRLEIWKQGNKLGWVFDNEKDELIFDEKYRMFGIDGTEYLEDEDVRDPIQFYVDYRVDELMDGRRLVKLRDELWYLIQHKMNSEKVKKDQKTGRSYNMINTSATQSVEDIANSDIARPLIEQSPTLIFGANRQARWEDYKKLSCTKEEFETIKSFQPSQYKFLIKKEEGSVIVNLDLSSMPKEYIKILSTSVAYKDQVQAIFNQVDKTQAQKVEELKALYR
jgi:type IV secretion system protein VirB4